jgi:hypothetical protein
MAGNVMEDACGAVIKEVLAESGALKLMKMATKEVPHRPARC